MKGQHFGRGPWGGFRHWGGPFGPGGGPRARRGDTRAAALLLIAEEPRNGYQLMQEIENRTDGVWRPSPGSMYPALQQLVDEGLIEPKDGKTYAITKEGIAYVEEHKDELGAPWESVRDNAGEDAADTRSLIGATAMAFVQVMRVGNQTQIKRARDVLAEARKKLYQILSEDE